MMTKEKNAVRTFRIMYTSGSSPKIREFISESPTETLNYYKFLTSDIAQDMLKIKILYSGFDGELNHA